MKFVIDQEVFNQYPDLKLGLIVIKGVNNFRRNSNVESLLRGVCAQKGREFASKELDTEPRVKCWYDAYGRFGINPKKNAPSIAALLKRVGSGKEIPHINALVDLYNYFSLKYLVPVGGEDLDWLCGDLRLTFTKGGEAFRPIGSIEVEQAKEGEVAYMDNGGITCRYWNHRECERTKFTEKTQNAVIIVEDISHMHMDEFGAMLKEMQNGIIKYIGGQVEPYILTEDRPEIDFGIQGRTNADDSKVPQQVKAFFEAKKKLKKPKKAPVKKVEEKITITDKNLLNVKIKGLLEQGLKAAFPTIEREVKIEYPASLDHGDYASNIALQLNGDVKRNPREVAEEIIEKIPENDLISKIEVAGPGFINFHLSETALLTETEAVLKEKEKYGTSEAGKNRTIIVEYSAPNIAKPLGVHHLLSTIIGQSIYNIYKHLGFNTVSINHIGDWGTQFGKLIFAYKEWGDRKTVEKDPIAELLKLYVRFHDEAEKDPEIEDKARHEFKIFEGGDKENHELWKWFVDESLKEIQKTYDHLGGIHFDYTTGESFYEDKMAPILEDGKKEGIIEEGEKGAFVIHYEDENIPTVPVQKKDGTTLYITRDFATLKYRLEHFKPEKIIYVVDIAQTMHFKQFFEASKRLGWYNDEAVHVWFGRMHMKDGNMSTRKGNIVLLDEVLDEAEKRAAKINKKVAKEVGIGSVKYNILSQNRTTDITFEWDRMLSLDGNSAPYLQYSYARAKSILRKAEEKAADTEAKPDEENVEEKIHALIRLFPKFKEQIILAAQEYKPNILSNYIFDLAQKFNSFYNSVPVLQAGEEDRTKRLKIVEAAAQILKNGLALLGVEVVEEM